MWLHKVKWNKYLWYKIKEIATPLSPLQPPPPSTCPLWPPLTALDHGKFSHSNSKTNILDLFCEFQYHLTIPFCACALGSTPSLTLKRPRGVFVQFQRKRNCCGSRQFPWVRKFLHRIFHYGKEWLSFLLKCIGLTVTLTVTR